MTEEKNLETRPSIDTISSGAELKRWYWRKAELQVHAKKLGLKTSSGKFVILERISHFLDTGEKQLPGDQRKKPSSSFDWHKEKLSKSTVITDSYKNSQNVRRFFKDEVGDQFKFNIEFMDWMKTNIGMTLGDACNAYLEIRTREKDPDYRTEIKDHNQFNQYTRDFLEDNPDLGMDDVRHFWALKIEKPSESGRHVYDRSDLQLELKK